MVLVENIGEMAALEREWRVRERLPGVGDLCGM
jgi:hypothetical protein